MNNSDIIAALSLAVTAIIFLIQYDDGFFKLKIKSFEKSILIVIVALIIFLSNYKIFERLNITFYSNPHRFYLRPEEWALILFLFLITISLIRIFSFKIYNNNPKIIIELLRQYQAEKKYKKLKNLLLQVFNLKNFDSEFAEQLNITIFNDSHFLEYFSATYPEVIITFCLKYKSASINNGENLYYILKGLFDDKSNQVFSEISEYKNENIKELFLDDYTGLWLNKELFLNKLPQKTNLPITSFIFKILKSHPFHLKEDTKYFLKNFTQEVKTESNNEQLLSENEIIKSFSRSTVFNILQFFRILNIELSYFDKQYPVSIDRVLLLLYSSWDFIEDCTLTKSDGVQLDNDSFTFNEYLLNYIFETYCGLFILTKLNYYSNVNKKDTESKENISWIFHQMFRKLDSIIKSKKIKNNSKKYYINRLLILFYDMSEYFTGEILNNIDKSIGYELRYSLDKSPWGDSELFRKLFIEVCKSYEFYRPNNERNNLDRSRFLYKYLLPFTEELEYKFTDK